MPEWPGMLPATIAGALLFGMVLALPGSIKASLAKRLGLDEDQASGLLAFFNLALIPFILVAGILVNPLGVNAVLLLGSLLTALAIFALAISRTSRAARYALLLTAGGGACLNVAAVVLMPRVFFEANETASLNLGCVFFGLGALMTPSLADALARLCGLRRALSVLAVVCLIPAFLAIWWGKAVVSPPDSQTDLAEPLANPIVWLAAVVFLFYGPLEGALGAWMSAYLTELGIRQRRPGLWLSAFWLIFLAARLLTAWLQEREILPRSSDPWLILGLALVAAVVLGNLAGSSPRGSSGLGLFILGGLLGPIFPTLVGLLFKHVQPADRGTAYGILYALGATGGLFLPPLIGAYARRKSLRGSLLLHTWLVLLLAATALLIVLQSE